MLTIEDAHVGIVGMGYVGLPLAVEFGKTFPTIGFDIDDARVRELASGRDRTLEVEPEELQAATRLSFTSEQADLEACNTYIVAVPTPIDRAKHPDLKLLKAASRTVGNVIGPGDVAVFESTVYPGATEEVCVPIIEGASGLEFDRDFFVGYSPERINPADKSHRLIDIVKVTSGSTAEAADYIDALYAAIIRAGTFKASSIRVAEAAKVIENTQRDVNIALVNELALIFERLGIDTEEVLEAAGTKWNFLPFRPGLVGGHCIGVDPYYLTHKAQEVGHHPEIILAGRRINDSMGIFVAERVVKLMAKRAIPVVGSNILVLGLTFKENCPDLRNSRIIDVVGELQQFGARVDVYDPWPDREEASHEYGIELIDEPSEGRYDAVVIGVAHDRFREMGPEHIRALGKANSVLFDVKYVLSADVVDGRL